MLVEKIKLRITEATKQKLPVERDVLRLVVGEVQTIEARNNKPVSDEQVESIIRKLIEANEETIQASSANQEKLKQENEVLSQWLPKTLTQDEIESFLKAEDVDVTQAKNDGQAMGMAMKSLKSGDQKVLGDDVKAVVAKLRS